LFLPTRILRRIFTRLRTTLIIGLVTLVTIPVAVLVLVSVSTTPLLSIVGIVRSVRVARILVVFLIRDRVIRILAVLVSILVIPALIIPVLIVSVVCPALTLGVALRTRLALLSRCTTVLVTTPLGPVALAPGISAVDQTAYLIGVFHANQVAVGWKPVVNIEMITITEVIVLVFDRRSRLW